MDNTPQAVEFNQAAFFLQYPPPDIPDVDWELVCPTVEGDYYLELVNGRWTKQTDGGPLHALGLRAIPRQRKVVFTENPCCRCQYWLGLIGQVGCSRGHIDICSKPPEPAKAVETRPQNEVGNTKEILEKWLKENGYDGLVSSDYDCGCRVGDLILCDGPCDRCIPGYKGPDPSGETDSLIYSTKDARDVAKAAAAAQDQDDMQPCPFCGSLVDPEKISETRLSVKDVFVLLFTSKSDDVAKPSTTL